MLLLIKTLDMSECGVSQLVSVAFEGAVKILDKHVA